VFGGILVVTDEKSRIRIRKSADPDPFQNVMDPEHCFFAFSQLLVVEKPGSGKEFLWNLNTNLKRQ
jgi:hypothetical protein